MTFKKSKLILCVASAMPGIAHSCLCRQFKSCYDVLFFPQLLAHLSVPAVHPAAACLMPNKLKDVKINMLCDMS
jgi:hypothetical protein